MNIFKRISVIFLLTFVLSAHSAHAGTTLDGQPLFRIIVPMEVGKNVVAESYPDNAKHIIGTVVDLPTKTRWPSYTASAWGEQSKVCASAVNAIHMLVAVENGRGRTLSIIPKETIAPAAGAGASIVISTKAGEGIFGAWAPPVGAKVETGNIATGRLAHLAVTNLPKRGEELVITVLTPSVKEPGIMPYIVDFENRPGGRVTEWTDGGYHILGRVLLPLGGTGRFEGTKFQRTGAIRANHCGVIDVSTSRHGTIGGFQIIPWDHALSSSEMQNAWNMTQWMIVGPADGASKLGATFPLFKKALVPGPADGEKLWDVWSTYGRKSLVMVRLDGGPWRKMPEYAGRNDSALKNVTHIRIYFPFTDEPVS